MAEIPVEKKSSMTWLWVLLAILAVVAIIWWATDDDEAVDTEIVGEQTVGADPITPPEPVALEAGVTIADILGAPNDYIGTNDFQAEVTVPEVPTDRGFWVEDQGQRLFALIIDNPQEEPKDINSGQQLRISEGMVRDATFIGDLPGAPLDQDTQNIVDNQDVFLVVDETNIEILSSN